MSPLTLTAASNAEEPPSKSNTHLPPPSLDSLPEEIVWGCLAHVPRSYYQNLSWVSKSLRAFVRSPELNRYRSILHKSSIYVCFVENKYHPDKNFHCLTLIPSEYRLVPTPTPFPPYHPSYGSLTVAVGSNIFFIGGGSRELSSDLWILDTLSGSITQGPSMELPRQREEGAVGVIDGKIYVIGGGRNQVEVFDPKLRTWELAGEEKVREIPRCSASVEGKVYMVEYEKTTVYNPREEQGGRERMVHMVSERLELRREGGRKERLFDIVECMCVVEDVLYGFFERSGVMWFDTKLSVWRRLVGRDGKEMFLFHADAMAEYDGKLVVFYLWGKSQVDDTITKSVRCKLVSLHRAGGKICGTIEWSGVVATVPKSFSFLHCVAVSR